MNIVIRAFIFTLITLINLLIVSFAAADILTKHGDRYELTVLTNRADTAHNSANAFADAVGKKLKSAYPSRVLEPDVNLQVFINYGRKFFRLTYSCRIVRTVPHTADYYFDRRGTILSGRTPDDARRNVEQQLARSHKAALLRRSLRHGHTPNGFVRDSSAGTAATGFWYIREVFVVAPR